MMRFLQQVERGRDQIGDLELLEIELETLWGDSSQRPVPDLVLATCAAGHVAALSEELPDLVAAELEQVVGAAPAGADPGSPPPALERCRLVLERVGGRAAIASGPSYVIPQTITFPPTAALVLAGAGVDDLRGANPGNWGLEEWDELIDGALGPWAMAVHRQQVIAICHTPACSARGAEAGVWTRPGHRGRGHAATVTAAWASLMAPAGRMLFYSTTAANRSSQRVAARLGLRRLGWLWQLT